MNTHGRKLIKRIAKVKLEYNFIDGCCSVPGCYERPIVILIDEERDDYQLCEKCLSVFRAEKAKAEKTLIEG